MQHRIRIRNYNIGVTLGLPRRFRAWNFDTKAFGVTTTYIGVQGFGFAFGIVRTVVK